MNWIAWFYEDRHSYFYNTQKIIPAPTRDAAIEKARKETKFNESLCGVSLIPFEEWTELNSHNWKCKR